MLNYQKMILAMVTIFEERRCQVEQRRVAKKGCKTWRTGEENDIFFCLCRYRTPFSLAFQLYLCYCLLEFLNIWSWIIAVGAWLLFQISLFLFQAIYHIFCAIAYFLDLDSCYLKHAA